MADLKHQNIIYSLDASREGKGMKQTLRESLGKTREAFCLRGMKSETGYTTVMLKIVYNVLFALLPTTTT